MRHRAAVALLLPAVLPLAALLLAGCGRTAGPALGLVQVCVGLSPAYAPSQQALVELREAGHVVSSASAAAPGRVGLEVPVSAGPVLVVVDGVPWGELAAGGSLARGDGCPAVP